MRVNFAVLADAANITSDEKLNILGVFGAVYGPKVPFVHAKMSIALDLEADPSEVGMTHTMKPALVDDKGNVMWEPPDEKAATLELNWIDPENVPTNPRFNLVMNLVSVKFPRFGHYAIQIKVDGQSIYEIPLEAVEKS